MNPNQIKAVKKKFTILHELIATTDLHSNYLMNKYKEWRHKKTDDEAVLSWLNGLDGIGYVPKIVLEHFNELYKYLKKKNEKKS